MKRDAEAFGDEPLELVQISRRLKEARSIESLLDDEGVDYLLEAAPYAARLLFVIPVTRVGVYFYARESEAPAVRETIAKAGWTIVEVLEDDEPEEPPAL